MSEQQVVRVMVLDAWDEIPMNLAAATTIADLKRRALVEARVPEDPDTFLVKFRGAALTNESATLSDEQIPTNAQLIVLRRHRRAVR